MSYIGGIDVEQLVEYIIKPALGSIVPDRIMSQDAVTLLTGTAAKESIVGKYVKQINGPALGIYQIEPNTHQDLWDNYILFRPDLYEPLYELYPRIKNNIDQDLLIYDNRYSTIMARLIYLRVPEILPESRDIIAQAKYWKKYYNTHLGSGTESGYISVAKRIGLDDGNL